MEWIFRREGWGDAAGRAPHLGCCPKVGLTLPQERKAAKMKRRHHNELKSSGSLPVNSTRVDPDRSVTTTELVSLGRTVEIETGAEKVKEALQPPSTAATSIPEGSNRTILPHPPKATSLPDSASMYTPVMFTRQLRKIFVASSDEIMAFLLSQHLSHMATEECLKEFGMNCRPSWLQLANNAFNSHQNVI
jgi:hypothetical protein